MDNIKRSYQPGSIWVYYKIYTGPKTADLLLNSLIKPVATNLIQNNTIEKWFFIRYQDPKFHLRVRFKANNLRDIGEIISKFSSQAESFVEDDLIWKLQLDSYHREIERYGSNTIDASESLFFYDSEMITSLLDLIDDSNEGEELRWLFSLKAIDAFLNDFKLTEDQKLYIIEQLKISFCTEFNMNRYLKKQLDKKYLSHKDKIEHFIELENNKPHEFSSLINCINKKREQTIPAVDHIKNTIDSNLLTSFLMSHIHMIMNRLFRSKNRLYEMVIYYILFKHYKALSGRRKYSKKLAS